MLTIKIKVFYSVKNGMIGLVLLNQSSSNRLDQFVINVDDIEKHTGIYFFPGLDDKLENELEDEIHSENWDFK